MGVQPYPYFEGRALHDAIAQRAASTWRTNCAMSRNSGTITCCRA